MSTITITEEGLLQVAYPAQPNESHIVADLIGAKWTITGNGTTGDMTVTDGASGVAEVWTLIDPAGTPWSVSLDAGGVLTLHSFDTNIVVAPAIHAPIKINGQLATGYQIFFYQQGTTIPATIYRNASSVSRLPQPILINEFGLPHEPIFIQVGLAYDVIIVPSGGGNAVRVIPSLVGGIPINIPTATEFSGGSYFASYVDSASVQVAGDVRGIFLSGRRVKVWPYTFSATVVESEYDEHNTIITLSISGGVIDNTVVSISAATLSPAAGPMPSRRHIGDSTFFSGPISIPPASGFNLIPVGLIRLRSGAAAPGWLQCNGQAVSRTDFNSLFAQLGIVFGSGDGVTTFNVPTIADVGPSHYWIYAKG